MKLSVHYLKRAGWLFLFGTITYFPIFLHLTSLPIQLWDESRLALNSYEMLKSGNVIVTLFDGSPDMWNTKPPLMIWLQAICMKIFGVDELAVRLPAALAALGTCMLLLWFSKKIFQQYSLGFIAVLVLITSNGYISEHVSRTGDYDSLLVLLSCASLFSFFCYTEAENKDRGKWLLMFFIWLTLAVLCKGIAGLLFLPAIGIYILVRKQMRVTLYQQKFYIGISIFLIFSVGYYLLREILNPGYFNAVLQNELGGRFLNTLEGHQYPFGYYFHDLLHNGFNTWFLLIPCGWIIGLSHINLLMRRMTLFLILCTLSYLLIISSSNTKLAWYTAPLYPLLALTVASFLNWIFDLLNHSEPFRSHLIKPIAGYLMLFLIFIVPYSNVVNKVYKPKIPDSALRSYDIPLYLKDAVEKNVNVDGSKVVFYYWPSSILFYQKEFAEQNQRIMLARLHDLNEGDRVIIANDSLYEELLGRFTVDTVSLYEHVRVIHINRRK